MIGTGLIWNRPGTAIAQGLDVDNAGLKDSSAAGLAAREGTIDHDRRPAELFRDDVVPSGDRSPI